MAIIAAIVWVPAIRKPFPNQIQARIPLVICLFVFTVNPLMGVAVANGVAGIIGTFWACFHMWVMNGIFPGGMKEGMSPTSATAIFRAHRRPLAAGRVPMAPAEQQDEADGRALRAAA